MKRLVVYSAGLLAITGPISTSLGESPKAVQVKVADDSAASGTTIRRSLSSNGSLQPLAVTAAAEPILSAPPATRKLVDERSSAEPVRRSMTTVRRSLSGDSVQIVAAQPLSPQPVDSRVAAKQAETTSRAVAPSPMPRAISPQPVAAQLVEAVRPAPPSEAVRTTREPVRRSLSAVPAAAVAAMPRPISPERNDKSSHEPARRSMSNMPSAIVAAASPPTHVATPAHVAPPVPVAPAIPVAAALPSALPRPLHRGTVAPPGPNQVTRSPMPLPIGATPRPAVAIQAAPPQRSESVAVQQPVRRSLQGDSGRSQVVAIPPEAMASAAVAQRVAEPAVERVVEPAVERAYRRPSVTARIREASVPASSSVVSAVRAPQPVPEPAVEAQPRTPQPAPDLPTPAPSPVTDESAAPAQVAQRTPEPIVLDDYEPYCDTCCHDCYGPIRLCHDIKASARQMYQHHPYEVWPWTYYYFRPYNYRHVAEQQEQAAAWGADPRQPYSRAVFDRVYEELANQFEPKSDEQ